MVGSPQPAGVESSIVVSGGHLKAYRWAPIDMHLETVDDRHFLQISRNDRGFARFLLSAGLLVVSAFHGEFLELFHRILVHAKVDSTVPDNAW